MTRARPCRRRVRSARRAQRALPAALTRRARRATLRWRVTRRFRATAAATRGRRWPAARRARRRRAAWGSAVAWIPGSRRAASRWRTCAAAWSRCAAGSANFVSWRLLGYEPATSRSTCTATARSSTRRRSTSHELRRRRRARQRDVHGARAARRRRAGRLGARHPVAAELPDIPLSAPDGLHAPATLGGRSGRRRPLRAGRQVGEQPATTRRRASPARPSSTATSSTARACGASSWASNIREGAHYTQFIVYDFDGDGSAEVACKTAPGTRRRRGKP